MKTGIYWQDPKYALKPGRDLILDPSLVLYLPLYRLDGASFMSKDKYGHLCTVTGALWTPHGRSFDGSDDYINAGNNESLNITEALTIEAWVYPETLPSTVRILEKWWNGSYCFNTSSSTKLELHLGLTTGHAGVISDANTLTTKQWRQVVATWDGNTVRLYVNGIEVKSQSLAGVLNGNTTHDVIVGAYAGDPATGNWDGFIGEARIYNRALTPSEIQRNYLAARRRYQ